MVGYGFHYKNSRKMEERKRIRPIKPEWLELLLTKKFFGICRDHKDVRKSEINIYCIECDLCMCSHCFAQDLTHRRHRHLQIRRYVYNDVVRIGDIQKLLDCSKVQTYVLNGARVIYLNAKAKHSMPSKAPIGSVPCKLCRRSINVPNRFCSIACKVHCEWVDDSNSVPSKKKSKSGPLIGPMTPDLEELAPKDDSACCSASLSQPSDSAEGNPGRRIVEEEEQALMTLTRKVSRRKGIPYRSPIF